MTSNDLSTLTLLLEKHFAKTQAQISEMRRENAEFREQIVKEEFNSFKEEIRSEFNSFKSETNSKLENVQSEIVTLQKDVVGFQHDVTGLYRWDYWLLSIILVLFALFSAITQSIAGVIALFKKKD